MIISPPLVGYVLTAARRDRLVLTLVLMIALAAAVSVLLGAAAMVEQDQFSVVFAAGGLRALGVLGIVLFVCFHMRRAFENKEVEFLLARPLSRMAFLFSHAAAFVILAACIAALVALPLLLAGAPHPAGLLLWAGSVVVEYAVVAVAALFFSITLSSAAGSALSALGLYALARLVGTLLGIAAAPADNAFFAALGQAMNVVSVVVPRLDLMAQTSWLVYGVEGSAGIGLLDSAGGYARWMAAHVGAGGFVLVQGAVFIALLLCAAAFDFSRRRF